MSESSSESIFGPQAVPGSASIAGVEAPRRGPVFGRRFAVATDQPQASLAALDVLRRGGNAADAAIAASAVCVVTKPQHTHLGGDAFALVWRKGPNSVDCLNAGGRAPLKASIDLFAAGIPERGPLSCTVPGLVDAWAELHMGFATMPLDALLEPALRLAEEGFPVSARLHDAMRMLETDTSRESAALRQVFLKDGRAYRPGELLRQPDLAKTLRRLADNAREGYHAREGFYQGETADLMVKAFREHGGLLDEADFEQSAAAWPDPLSTSFAACDVYEQALPSQGIILLLALNIAECFPLAEWGPTHPDAVHVLIEATKLAFADSRRYAADPEFETVPVEELLSKEYARRRAAAIDPRRAGRPQPGMVTSSTTEFVVADVEMAVAFIQSVFSPWGSRFLVPGTGIVMNNRLRGFSTNPADANSLKPGKRTVHTLNTFLALREGRLAIGGGTPGMDFQVQNNLQSVVGVLCWGLDLQAAVDMPRWVALANGALAMESRFPPSLLDELAARGHDVRRVAAWDATIARSQLLAELPDGGWAAASDLRGEGVALAI